MYNFILEHPGRGKGTSFPESLMAQIRLLISFVLKKKRRETQHISRQNKGKNKKMKCSSFCIQDNLFCCCCRPICCCCCFLFRIFDGPLGPAGLVTQHFYLAVQCESTQTQTSASTSAWEAFTCWHRRRRSKVNKKCLSAFLRRQPKSVLDKWQGEIRHVGALLNYSCLHFEDFRGRIEFVRL